MATTDRIGFKTVLILIFPQGALAGSGCAGLSGSKDHELEWAELLVVAANSSRN